MEMENIREVESAECQLPSFWPCSSQDLTSGIVCEGRSCRSSKELDFITIYWRLSIGYRGHQPNWSISNPWPDRSPRPKLMGQIFLGPSSACSILIPPRARI